MSVRQTARSVFIAMASVAGILMLATPLASANGDSRDPCLSPLAPNDAPPQPRNALITLDPPNNVATVEACVVSNLSRIDDLQFQVTVFNKRGIMVGGDGRASGQHTAVIGAPDGAPKMFFRDAKSVHVNGSLHDLATDKALIVMQWKNVDGSPGSSAYYVSAGPGCACGDGKKPKR